VPHVAVGKSWLDAAAKQGIHLAMRLIDDLAATHLFYSPPVPTLPTVLLIDVPARYASPNLPFGRYYPIIVESQDELRELMAYLQQDRPAMIAPSILDHRPSALQASDISLCRYEPPVTGWPWLLLCHWPAPFTQMVPSPHDDFARQAYTTELFLTQGALEDMQLRLLDSLGALHAVNVRLISGGPAGHA